MKKIGKIFFNSEKFVEDVQEMKKQLKAMNDKNMTYMQQNLDLEEVWSQLWSHDAHMTVT